jgi:tRNA pseudouridine38-40 synthase
MRNIALRVAYDGTDFIGSQWQNQGRSIQGALEEAWQQLTQERRRVVLAGRTDAGVHAQGQVANIRSETGHSTTTIQRGLNAILPDDVQVQAVQEVDLQFHARHSATGRNYRYLIDNNPTTLPMLRNYVLSIEQRLDTETMAEALPILEGTHDFAAFTVASAEQRTTVRRCDQARLTEVTLFDRTLIAVELSANAFLQHMVRVIIGTVVLVGRGRMSVDAFRNVLQGRDRKAAGPTAAAHGLTLMAVTYPPEALDWP